ncbi:uncharacterized protein LOC108239381 [Kryptolebias marmoratus]|uniref:uncharacterized protein LOC108239381 n=1 Tax=Kryptolebias marmoratus TaxID=37003 RepID=UPI0007F8A69C|nr:uncharacterized protein LOC108239381 [Kryptolebias marmoratus]
MSWILHVSVVLLNVGWISFFLTLDPSSVFIQKRSSSDEETLLEEFCLQPPSDIKTQTSPTLHSVSWEQNVTQNEMFTSVDMNNSSAAPEHDPKAVTDGHLTASTGSNSRRTPPNPTSSPTGGLVELLTYLLLFWGTDGHLTASTASNSRRTPPNPTLSPIGGLVHSHFVKDLNEDTLTTPYVKKLTSSKEVLSDDSEAAVVEEIPEAPVKPRVNPNPKPAQEDSIGPDNCCFEFYDKIIRRSLISSYVRTDYRCAKAGVIFTLTKGRRICVDPSRPWVKKIISKQDTGPF